MAEGNNKIITNFKKLCLKYTLICSHKNILHAFKPACIFVSIPICEGTTKNELSEKKR